MLLALTSRLSCSSALSTIRCRKRGTVPVAREQRKLAAILAADVVGYSRLMGASRAARWRGFASIAGSGEPTLTHHGDRRSAPCRPALYE